MSVLVYTESEQGKFKKAALEVASYAKASCRSIGNYSVQQLLLMQTMLILGNYGVDQVLNVNNDALNCFNAKHYAAVIEQAAETRRCKSSQS